MSLFLAFGLTFEVPVAVILLVKTGVVSIAKLQEARPYVIVGAFVIAAIITPPDVVSQFMLALPMCLLYELGILISRVVAKRDEMPVEPGEDEHPVDRIEATGSDGK